jgi:hypothetical protein
VDIGYRLGLLAICWVHWLCHRYIGYQIPTLAIALIRNGAVERVRERQVFDGSSMPGVYRTRSGGLDYHSGITGTMRLMT